MMRRPDHRCLTEPAPVCGMADLAVTCLAVVTVSVGGALLLFALLGNAARAVTG